MKRSVQVSAPLLASAALAVLTGCHPPEMQRCVDAQNHVVDQKFCANLPPQQGINSGVGPGGMGFYPYRYYYGGGGGWNLGSTVYGGGYTSYSGHSYTTSSSAAHSSTSRGGFGSSMGGGHSSGGAGE